MRKIHNKRFDDDTKRFNEIAKYSKRCSCGHSVLINPDKEKVLCSWCHRYVFRKKEDEFKYRVKEMMK